MATRLLAFKFIFLAENSFYIFFAKEFIMGKFFLCIWFFLLIQPWEYEHSDNFFTLSLLVATPHEYKLFIKN